MAIGEVDVYPRLERLSDSERPEFATFFSSKLASNPEFRDDRAPRFHFFDYDEDAAVVRTQDLITWFCREAGIDRDRITQGTTPDRP